MLAPRTVTAAAFLLSALGLAGAAGCSLLSGLDDFELVATGAGGAGGATTSTTFTTTSTGTGGGQGGSGASGAEDCLDGDDNDGDGNADCADTDCNAGYECVDEAPAEWGGVVLAHRVGLPSAEPAPPCGDGSAPAVYLAAPAGAPSCEACSCSFSGATCGPPQIACYWGNVNCNGFPELTPQASGDACISNPSLPNASPQGSCRVVIGSQATSQGSCLSVGGGMMAEEAWAEEVRVCADATGGGCAQGQACVPRASDDAAACVVQAGTNACPAGWTATEIQAYEGGQDDRSCSGCNCDVGTVTCTVGAYTAYDLDNCTGTSIPVSTSCVSVTALADLNTFSLRPVLGTPVDGACPSSQPSGAVQPVGATKICCQGP